MLLIDGSPLALDDVVAVAHRRVRALPGPGLEERMAAAQHLVADVVSRGQTVYGITTGFGAMASTSIPTEDAVQLQVNLLRSHAAGVGDPLPPTVVRAMLLLRARTLASGHSGVRSEVVHRLLDMLSNDVLPVVPEQGSVGASGDLAPFAHLALPLIGEGEVFDAGVRRPAGDALANHGWDPIELRPKEGLSLLNGTEGMLAQGVLAWDRARTLAATADAACALSVEALTGSARPYRPDIHSLRPHPGQRASAARIASLIAGSGIGASHAGDFVHAVQDAYSLRCAPQVHGAVRDTIDHAGRVFEIEAGSVVDNPIVFPATGEVISGGNFHGQPLAFALDFLAIAVTELGAISERRTDRILDPQHSSGLPPFLSNRPGLESGYMLAQYTAAALVAENRVLSHPASVESIPTSGSQEDHVSMGWGAARKLGTILDNTTRVLAVELVCAARGIELRAPLLPASGTSRLLSTIRRVVPPLTGDRPIGADIESIRDLIEQSAFASFDI